MQNTIEKMRKLQEILVERISIEQEMKESPRVLEQKETILHRLQQSNVEKLEQKETIDETIKNLRFSLSETEEELVRLEQQISEISTQREYEALDKEIHAISEKEKGLRKEILTTEEKRKELDRQISSEKELIEEQKVELEKTKQSVEKLQEEQVGRLEEISSQGSDITKDLDAELIFKFERIIRSKGGKGILPLKRNICTSCNMILPNQFVNDVRDTDTIRFCPYCSTILYFSTESEVDDESSDEAGILADIFNFEEEFTFEESDLEMDADVDDDYVDGEPVASADDEDEDNEVEVAAETELDDKDNEMDDDSDLPEDSLDDTAKVENSDDDYSFEGDYEE